MHTAMKNMDKNVNTRIFPGFRVKNLTKGIEIYPWIARRSCLRYRRRHE